MGEVFCRVYLARRKMYFITATYRFNVTVSLRNIVLLPTILLTIYKTSLKDTVSF